MLKFKNRIFNLDSKKNQIQEYSYDNVVFTEIEVGSTNRIIKNLIICLIIISIINALLINAFFGVLQKI